jgi:hypothetical protein
MKRSSLITAALCLAAAGWAQAHSMHQSTAEAEYNPKTQKLEVSLTVFIDDLELALMRHSERPMSIAKTPAAEFDTQIQSYLTKTFVLTEVTGKAAGIEWVGRESGSDRTDDPTVTLHFELPLVSCLFKDQTNLLHLRSGANNLELKFMRDAASRAIDLSE